jgi:hypothetical protein
METRINATEARMAVLAARLAQIERQLLLEPLVA